MTIYLHNYKFSPRPCFIHAPNDLKTHTCIILHLKIFPTFHCDFFHKLWAILKCVTYFAIIRKISGIFLLWSSSWHNIWRMYIVWLLSLKVLQPCHIQTMWPILQNCVLLIVTCILQWLDVVIFSKSINWSPVSVGSISMNLAQLRIHSTMDQLGKIKQHLYCTCLGFFPCHYSLKCTT